MDSVRVKNTKNNSPAHKEKFQKLDGMYKQNIVVPKKVTSFEIMVCNRNY
jgi:hypothetical protein